MSGNLDLCKLVGGSEAFLEEASVNGPKLGDLVPLLFALGTVSSDASQREFE